MISRFRFHVTALLGAALLSAAIPQATAQTPSVESHPACKVVYDYLTMILTRRYDQSADIMDENALASLQKDYVERIKNAPTMDDEEVMITRLGVTTVEQVSQMKPRAFYTAYNLGLQKQHKVPDDVLAIVRKTLTFKVLSVAQETDRTVHVLVRTKHENGKVHFESLDLISLVKNGEKWQIAPNLQAPKITPVAGAANGKTADPVKSPDPVKTPAADPVKPVKPAVPPKTAPKRKPNP
jgi:hypothetical protein